jgi:hypothetical protein
MAERRQNMFTLFTVGQKVWLDTRNMKTNYHKKMAPKREGPFEVEEVLGPVTYQLKLPTTWRVHNVFHAVLLKPYIKTEVHRENFLRPILDILDGEEVYNVETILNTGKEDDLINIWSNKKDIQSPRPRGNLKQLSRMMVICCQPINSDINYETRSILWNVPKSWKDDTTGVPYLTGKTNLGLGNFSTP